MILLRAAAGRTAGLFRGNMVYAQQAPSTICPWLPPSPGTDCAYLALSGVRETSGSIRCTLNAHRCSLKVAAWGEVIFLHFPLLIIAIYAFNTEDAAFSFPPQGLTLKWFSVRRGVATSSIP